MRVTGIICEYDPFHNGHEYLLRRAREDSDAVVCVMSGNFTQRGGMAMADKYTRAEMAVRCGADLVLELPYPFCMASAEYFAGAGADILASVGADSICFGSESGDIEALTQAARLAVDLVVEETTEKGTAAGYFEALDKAYRAQYGKHLESTPNDILGMEYIKAILKKGYDITPRAVTRLGDGFREEQAGQSPFASATALRGQIREHGMVGLERYMPAAAVSVLEEAIRRGDAPVDLMRIESAVLAFFRLADASTLERIAELGNGLEYRLCEAARQATCLEEFWKLVATKRYTDARIRRAALYAMTGVTGEQLDTPVAYTTVLAANRRGCELLSFLRKREGGIPVITKPAEGKNVSPAQYAAGERADALFTLAMPIPRDNGEFLRHSAVVFK